MIRITNQQSALSGSLSADQINQARHICLKHPFAKLAKWISEKNGVNLMISKECLNLIAVGDENVNRDFESAGRSIQDV